MSLIKKKQTSKQTNKTKPKPTHTKKTQKNTPNNPIISIKQVFTVHRTQFFALEENSEGEKRKLNEMKRQRAEGRIPSSVRGMDDCILTYSAEGV